MAIKKPFYIFTSDHSGLPLATHLQDEGERVTLVLIHPTIKHGKYKAPKTPIGNYILNSRNEL